MTLLLILACGEPAPPPAFDVVDVEPVAWHSDVLAFPQDVRDALDRVADTVGLAARSEPETCAALEAVTHAVPLLDAALATRTDPALRPALSALAPTLPAIRLFIPNGPEPRPARAIVNWPELSAAAGKARSGPVITWGVWASDPPPWSGECLNPRDVEPWVLRLARDPGPACIGEVLAPAVTARMGEVTSAPCYCGPDGPARLRRLADAVAAAPAVAASADALRARADDAATVYRECR